MLALLGTAVAMLAAQVAPADALFERGRAAQVRGDLRSAESAYREYLKTYPARPEVLANLGAILARRENYREAIGLYRQALRLDPSLAPLHLNLGLAYMKQGEHEPAVAEFEQFLKASPGNRQAMQLRAMSLLELERFAEAEAQFRQLDAGELPVALGLSTALLRQQKNAEARAVIEPVLARGDSAELQLTLGQALLEEGRIDEALVAFEKARSINPKLPLLRMHLGAAYWRQKRTDAALAEWRAEYEARPGNFEAVYTLGAALALRPDARQESERLLRKAVAQRPSSARACFQLARLIWQNGRNPEAAALLSRATKADPNLREAFFLYGTVLQAQGRKVEAARAFARVKQISEQDVARQQDLFSEQER